MIRRLPIQAALGILAGLILAALPVGCQQKPGVDDTEIKIGNTTPYSGPASAYATYGKSIAAYFAKVNAAGGINGRKINFITYDDGYSPPKTVEQVRRLVEQDQVLLLFMSVGTPSNTAIHDYMNSKQVPQLFPSSGATKWAQPKAYPWTMSWRPNYQTEARIYAKYILAHLPNAKVGILFQNDDYGKDYLKGFKDGLGDKAATMIIAEQSYEFTDPTVDSQVVNLKNSGADVFFNITTPKFAAQAIRKAHEIGWKPTQFLNNVSSSISAVLQPAGLTAAQDIITALFLKDPNDLRWADDVGRMEWLEWMRTYYPDGNVADIFNVFGYTVAQTLAYVLKQAGSDLSRENVMRQAASIKGLELPMLLPGIKIDTGPDDFSPIEQMQLSRFIGERWELFGDIISG